MSRVFAQLFENNNTNTTAMAATLAIIKADTLVSLLFTGSYLYGEYPDQDIASITIASATINDNYCAVAFSYSSNMVELQVKVDGLGSVWSSLTLGGNGASHGWVYEAILIDFESVGILENRNLSFEADMVDGNGVVAFFAVDNITLHPCIDCSIPGIHSIGN